MTPFDDDLDLDARLRSLFGDGDFDVAAPAGTDARVLAGARRARRRTTAVRAVSVVAAVSAAAAAAAAAAGSQGDRTNVLPARSQDPRCQEWWVPYTPTPGEEPRDFNYPTWTADPEPLGPQTDPGATSPPNSTPTPSESLGFTPRPMRGPHGGTLCTVVDGKAEVMTREGYVWPTDLPVPTYSMLPGSTPGMSVPPSFLPAPTDMRMCRQACPADRPSEGWIHRPTPGPADGPADAPPVGADGRVKTVTPEPAGSP
jgi:hypothetical protein